MIDPSLISSLIWLFLGITATWGMSRWLDWLSGGKFKDVASQIRTQPLAAAVYYGARWFGICFVVGSILATVRL